MTARRRTATESDGNPRRKGAGQPRRVTILGSTGSVGRSTVDLLSRNRDTFTVEALTANSNAGLLAEQARALGARFAAVAEPGEYAALKEALAGTGIEVAGGRAALVEACERPADWVMAGIVGAAGLEPTLAAIRQGRIVAFANKEVLVCGGSLFMREVRAHGATLLPVDSEHNAIWQCFDFERVDNIEKITLTCSGGPFRERSLDEMRDMTPEQAVAHPTWRMGAKISVDSATLMNKGLELIEAHHLFQLDPERIDIVVHPQSIVHGLVTYRDGSVLAHLGSPDMRTPIAYALGWPDRTPAPTKRLDLAEVGRLTFEAPDPVRFPALRLAREALTRPGGPTVLNAANETAVHAFLGGEIGFLDIAATVERTLELLPGGNLDSLDDVYDLDKAARATAAQALAKRSAARLAEPAEKR
ncbi:MAG: 1-deoxy-D-xylulose-5-phosphate reductoisomerase [Alphaproteobacteria bacterium]|nr:1-deoxy-D-xylulose-5-phosphate reductoisomerase [Alphaproteobacteria bacterium]MBV9153809.1 1-deoxy-D-xylulose-5-phosphate reductoisomerase [Alphaproteobacteria bacterium]